MDLIDLRSFGVRNDVYYRIKSILDYFKRKENFKAIKKHKIVVNDKSLLSGAKKVSYQKMLALFRELSGRTLNKITIYLLADEDPEKGYIITHIAVESKGKVVYALNKG